MEPTTKKPQKKSRVGQWAKLIAGALLAFSLVVGLLSSEPYFVSGSGAEALGFNLSHVLFPLLGVWLLYSWHKGEKK